MNKLVQNLFAISEAVRYVAVYQDKKLYSSVRPGLSDVSSSESDLYEEILVNPTILKLATQRGEIDCGGLNYLLIRYGHFYQFVMPMMTHGHVSVCIEPDADAVDVGRHIADRVQEYLDSAVHKGY